MNKYADAWREHQRRRWMRHDAWRWERPGRPAVDTTDVEAASARWSESDVAVDPRLLDEVLQEQSRLRVMFAEVEVERARSRYLARKYNSNQPRVPAGNPDGGQWTSGEGSGSAEVASDADTQPQQARFNPNKATEAAKKAVSALAALYTWLSTRNSADRQAVAVFNARDYRASDGNPLTPEFAGSLTRDQVKDACPRFPEVEARANAAVDTVMAAGGDKMTPANYGTAVHTALRDQIRALRDPNFRAEQSFLKEQTEVPYGAKGSIRIDVYENVGNGTVCVYDIKTGNATLTPARMVELASHVYDRFPTTQRIVVTEVKPPPP